jgi:hypothetical protein
MNDGEFKDCPYCKEKIRAKASKCRYCHSDLTEAEGLNNNIDIKNTVITEAPLGKNIWSMWWMKSIVGIIIVLILTLAVFSMSKLSNQMKEDVAVKGQGPTVVNTGNETIDTWVNASNFLSSKQGGLYALHGEFLSVLSADESFQNLADIEAKANELRSIDVPVVLQDLFANYLAGIDLLVDSANYAKNGDWDMAGFSLDSGSEITIEVLGNMSERVAEELGKALEE